LERAKLSEKRALGSVLGAFVGDAAGAYLEFWRGGKIREKDVEEALTFPGGGAWLVGPGQITDDSEMAMCIL
jgi:ADP-ribosylglycohydrolase